jgi:hypothetical protein
VPDCDVDGIAGLIGLEQLIEAFRLAAFDFDRSAAFSIRPCRALAACAAALDGAKNCFGGVTARGAVREHVERRPRCGQVALQVGQPSVEGAQAGNSVGDVGAPAGDDLGQADRRLVAVPGMAPRSDSGGVVERNLETAQVDQEAQVLDVGVGVLAVVVRLSSRAGQPALAFIEAHRVGRNTDSLGQLPDSHGSNPFEN